MIALVILAAVIVIAIVAARGDDAPEERRDVMDEERRKELMIQRDSNDVNREIMIDNLRDASREPEDPMLLRDQQRLDSETGTTINDRLEKK